MAYGVVNAFVSPVQIAAAMTFLSRQVRHFVPGIGVIPFPLSQQNLLVGRNPFNMLDQLQIFGKLQD